MSPMPRVPYTISLDPEVLERIRTAAFFGEETVSGFFETSALDRLARLEKERGEPYPKRQVKVKTGRPGKSPSKKKTQ